MSGGVVLSKLELVKATAVIPFIRLLKAVISFLLVNLNCISL